CFVFLEKGNGEEDGQVCEIFDISRFLERMVKIVPEETKAESGEKPGQRPKRDYHFFLGENCAIRRECLFHDTDKWRDIAAAGRLRLFHPLDKGLIGKLVQVYLSVHSLLLYVLFLQRHVVGN